MTTSLIGRQADISHVRSLLDRGERIVTICGSAGVGKSRLAREVLQRLEIANADPTAKAKNDTTALITCDLSDARTADDAAVTLACAFRAPASFGSSPFARIAARIAEHGPLILVLDNADGLSVSNIDWLAWLLDGAPELQVILTAHEPFGVLPECVHRLEPLSTEDACALVLELTDPSPKLDDLERDSLARLVALLGHLPLNLELTASLVAEHGATKVLSSLLKREPHEEIIAWAWRHLDAHERQVLSRASLFRSGFTLDAALAVGIGSMVHDLAEKSWLELQLLPPPGTQHARLAATRVEAGHAPRFEMHRAIQAIAESQLLPDDSARERITGYQLDIADALLREISAPGAKAALERIAAERENLTSIAVLAIAMRDGTAAARALLALVQLALAYGPVTPFLSLVRQALDLPLTIDRRIGLLAARGRMLRRLGLLDDAEVTQHEAAELAHGAGFRREEARLLGELGLTAYSRSLFSVALTRFRAALALQIDLGDFTEQAVTLTQLAMVHRERGAIDDSRHAAMRALPIHRSSGNARYESVTLVELAICDLASGDLERSRAMLASIIPSISGVLAAFAHLIAGVVEHTIGDLDAAEHLYEIALRSSRDLGHARLEATILAWRGILSFDRGNFEQAKERLEPAVDALMAIGDARYGALAHGYLYASILLLGNEAQANELLAIARSLVDEGDPARTAIDILEATLWAAPLAPEAEAQTRLSWDVRLAFDRHHRTHPQLHSANESNARGTTNAGSAPPPRSACQVPVDGAFIELRDGRQIACDRRVATQRLLAALAKARAESPGRPIAADALVAVGWPNERILSGAARNRLRVALSWLRKNGLGRGLASGSEGYFLDPEMVDVCDASN